MSLNTLNTQNTHAATAANLSEVADVVKTAPSAAKGIQGGVDNVPDAQMTDVLALVRSRDLSPEASSAQALDPDTSAKLEQIEQLLNSSNSSDAARLLGRLMVEIGALQRKEALTDRLNAREAARGELNSAADKLNKAATATMSGATANLVLGMVSAATAVAFAGKSMTALKGPDTQVATSTAQAINMQGGAISGLSSSAGQFGNSIGQSTAQNFQADQSREQAEAEVTKSEGEMEASEQQALQEFINQMIQFVKEMKDAEVEQLAVVTRG